MSARDDTVSSFKHFIYILYDLYIMCIVHFVHFIHYTVGNIETCPILRLKGSCCCYCLHARFACHRQQWVLKSFLEPDLLLPDNEEVECRHAEIFNIGKL